MEIVLAAIFALLGLAIGSFLNVCIDRLPAGKSLAYPPSHCDACQHSLATKDLVPVFSWLWLRGKCRYCRASIPRRVPLVETLTGVYFLLVFLRFGLSLAFAVTAFWGCVFLVILFIDWEHKLILNRITGPMAIVALAVLAADSLMPGRGPMAGLTMLFRPSLLSGLIGAAGGFVLLLIPALINPRGMGFGDVKMAGLIGLVTGFPLVFVALMVGIISGGLVAISLLVLKIKGRKEVIPFGPFLSMGTIVTLLWGNQILSWYTQGFF
ncbi:MAG: prepilin peptidase [Dehalococcoidales bacterium]|nr:prepilin peptidase [Dehalococcoidales bacterium]